LAAEVAWKFPQKRVRLVTRHEILPGLPAKCQKYSKTWLSRHGVETVENTAVEHPENYPCQPGEIVFPCTGLMLCDIPRPCKANTRKSSDASVAVAVDFTRRINTDRFLRMRGHENIFVIGDAMSHESNEPKTAFAAESNAALAVENIVRLVNNQQPLAYPEGVAGVRPGPRVLSVSLGKYDGCVIFNDFVMCGLVAAFAKWFIERTKIQQLRGRPPGNVVWAVGEPAAFVLNRIWQFIAQRFLHCRPAPLRPPPPASPALPSRAELRVRSASSAVTPMSLAHL